MGGIDQFQVPQLKVISVVIPLILLIYRNPETLVCKWTDWAQSHGLISWRLHRIDRTYIKL